MHIHYIEDRYNNAYRIWVSTDPNDYFDMVPTKEFKLYLPFVKRFPNIFVADFPDEDSGELVCPLCIKEQEKAPNPVRARGRPKRSQLLQRSGTQGLKA